MSGTRKRAGGAAGALAVWASWCRACAEEAPLLSQLSRDFAGRLRLIGIDVNDGRRRARTFVARYKLDFPHLLDPRTLIAKRLGVLGVPTVYLVDRHGSIAAIEAGVPRAAKLRALVEALVADT